MKLPEIDVIATERDMVSAFLGYNHNDTTNQNAPNQFYDMQNLSSDAYPSLAPRAKRAKVIEMDSISGMYAGEKLAYVSKGKLFYDFNEVKGLTLTEGEKKIVGMGAYLVIFPDNVMYNTNTGDIEEMGFSYETKNDVMFRISKADGSDINCYVGSVEPEDKELYPYWLDTSSDTAVMKLWSNTNQAWNSVSATYVKIQEMPELQIKAASGYETITVNTYEQPDEQDAVKGNYWYDPSDETLYQCNGTEWVEVEDYKVIKQGFGKSMKEYDGIDISGVDKQASEDFNATMIIYGVGVDYVVVAGVLGRGMYVQRTGSIQFKRRVPEMDYVCELDNRLWGCSSTENELYACKLGDPKNWYSYAGVLSDSYAVTIGSPGDFTGAVAYGGYILFFKEDCIYKVYGTEPSNYTIKSTHSRGIQKGSGKSVCILDEILYYKSGTSVCAYDGSLPTEISEDLGKRIFKKATAGGSNGKLYMCMQEDLTYTIYVYDTKRRIWYKEDDKQILWFANCEGCLYYAEQQKDKVVIGVIDKENRNTFLLPGITYGTGEEKRKIYPGQGIYPKKYFDGFLEEEFEWYGVTNILGMDLPDNKYISNITLRLFVDEGAVFRVYIQYDSDNLWRKILDMNQTIKRTYTIPLRVQRCDHFQIKFEGKGMFRLFSYTKTIEQGSEW